MGFGDPDLRFGELCLQGVALGATSPQVREDKIVEAGVTAVTYPVNIGVTTAVEPEGCVVDRVGDTGERGSDNEGASRKSRLNRKRNTNNNAKLKSKPTRSVPVSQPSRSVYGRVSSHVTNEGVSCVKGHVRHVSDSKMATMKFKEKGRLNKMGGGGQGVSADVRMLMESEKNVSNNSHSQNEAELSSEERKGNIEATLRPMEENVIQRPIEENVIQRPMEENVIQRPMEENVIQRPMEENVIQRPMEQDVGITQKPIHIKENITQKPISPEQELALTCPPKAQDTLIEPPTQPHTPSHPQHVTDININQSKGGPSSHEAKTPSIDQKYHQLVHQPNAHLATAAPISPQQGAYLQVKSPTRASETNRHFPEGELVGGGRDDKGNRSRASISNHIGGAKSCPGVGAAGVSLEHSVT